MRLGRLCAQLALACLLAGGGAAAQTAPPHEFLVVRPGQSATEIALDQVPAGTTIDQFLLAIYQLNPQAFAAGDLNRLLSQVRLRLPTVEEANRVGLEPAREQLAQLKAGAASAAPSPASSVPAATEPTPTAAAEPATAPAAHAASSAAVAPTAPPEAAPAAMPAWLIGVMGALAALGLLAWRLRQPAKAGSVIAPVDEEARAQGRFRPVLPAPAGAWPSGRMVRRDDAPLAANDRPEGRAPAGDSKPALFDLDLNLDGQAPPLDMGGLSLDLDSTPAGARPSGRMVPKDDAPLAANDRPGGRAPAGEGKAALFDLDLNLDGNAPPLDLPRPRKERP